MTDRACLLNDYRMSGRPIRAKYKHFNTTWGKLLTIHLYLLFFLYGLVIVQARMRNLVWLLRFSCLPIRNIVPTHLRECPSMSYDHAEVFVRRLSHPGNFSVARAEFTGLEHLVVLSNDFLVWCTFPLSAF